jgi:hypothetical protein
MAIDHILQDADVEPQTDPSRRDVGHRAIKVGLWLSTHDVQAVVPCKTLKGAYEWIRRHGIVRRRDNGLVSRRDVEAAKLKLASRPRRIVAAASLSNLRKAR